MRTKRLDTAAAPAVAVIGCGAIARTVHVPALAQRHDVRGRLVLVDQDRDRAKALAEEFGIATTAADYRDVLPAVQGVVIAVPHHLHFRIALDCLRAGVHVLCEKPLATSAAEAAELVAASEHAGVALAVNHVRRLFPPSEVTHELLQQGAVGNVRFVGYYDGAKYDWPTASGFAFGLQGDGKGVLLDIGSHVLDLICWWLGRPPRVTDYVDDSLGGSEAVAKVSFADGDVRGEVHLSWLAKLRNGFRIEGDAGVLTGSVFDWETLQLTSPSGRTTSIPIKTRVRSVGDLGPTIVENFLAVIERGAAPLVSGRDVVPSIALIEQCYARRRRFAMPWRDDVERIRYAS
ncbi:MAG: Gfo/Idh/MocA family protein [Gemmatimonadales bacterium]